MAGFLSILLHPLKIRLVSGLSAFRLLGGIVVGFMARFGSKAIRGHGIPEAMETNSSSTKAAFLHALLF